jgi:hypothetical protein
MSDAFSYVGKDSWNREINNCSDGTSDGANTELTDKQMYRMYFLKLLPFFRAMAEAVEIDRYPLRNCNTP